ncbi:MAG: hypothetical protein WCK34_00100 [Bacteroidota bacterium]
MVPGAPFAAVVAIQVKKILNRFEESGAVSPDRARTLEELGLSNRIILRRLISRGVISEAQPGRYYLDPKNLADFNEKRRKKVTAVLGAIILALLIYALFSMVR